MTELTIKIKMDNGAFVGDPSYEVARILTKYINHISVDGDLDRCLKDVNGNTVGSASVMEGP